VVGSAGRGAAAQATPPKQPRPHTPPTGTRPNGASGGGGGGGRVARRSRRGRPGDPPKTASSPHTTDRHPPKRCLWRGGGERPAHLGAVAQTNPPQYDLLSTHRSQVPARTGRLAGVGAQRCSHRGCVSVSVICQIALKTQAKEAPPACTSCASHEATSDTRQPTHRPRISPTHQKDTRLSRETTTGHYVDGELTDETAAVCAAQTTPEANRRALPDQNISLTPHDRRAIHCQTCQCLNFAGCQPVRRCAIRRCRLSISGTRGTPCDRPFTGSRVPEAHIRRRNGPTGLFSIRSGARRPKNEPFLRTHSSYRDSFLFHFRCTYHGNLSGWRGVSGPDGVILLVERHFRTRSAI